MYNVDTNTNCQSRICLYRLIHTYYIIHINIYVNIGERRLSIGGQKSLLSFIIIIIISYRRTRDVRIIFIYVYIWTASRRMAKGRDERYGSVDALNDLLAFKEWRRWSAVTVAKGNSDKTVAPINIYIYMYTGRWWRRDATETHSGYCRSIYSLCGGGGGAE